MKLTSPQGAFELTILDYEYSDSPHFLERNWLLISLKTRTNGREYQRMAPLLSTWELELLCDWMRAVVSNRSASPKLTFVDPALTFRADSTGQTSYQFRIRLAQDAAPDWQMNPHQPYWLTVDADSRQVQLAIRDLESQLNRFPVRN